MRANAPLLLVLAGTPGLPAHLAAMNASFWSRLGEGRLGIALLSYAGARAALVEPLAAHDVDIEGEALHAIIEHSQRYPYFIQLWGEALWKQRLAIEATRLTAAHADAARPHVIARITDYYQDRYRELEARGLLPAAVAVASLFHAETTTATDHDLNAALAATGGDAADRLAAREELNSLGYIWSPPAQLPPVVWVAGIPSLMTYVHDPPLRPPRPTPAATESCGRNAHCCAPPRADPDMVAKPSGSYLGCQNMSLGSSNRRMIRVRWGKLDFVILPVTLQMIGSRLTIYVSMIDSAMATLPEAAVNLKALVMGREDSYHNSIL